MKFFFNLIGIMIGLAIAHYLNGGFEPDAKYKAACEKQTAMSYNECMVELTR